jgi:hypothetical protein
VVVTRRMVPHSFLVAPAKGDPKLAPGLTSRLQPTGPPLWMPAFELVKKSLGAEMPPIVIPGWPEGPGPVSMNTGFSLALIDLRS